MAEDIWQNLPYEKSTESVFEGGWPNDLMAFPEHDADQWAMVRSLRDDVNKVLESARNDKLVGASLDAAAYVYVLDEESKLKESCDEKYISSTDTLSGCVVGVKQ